VPATPLLMDLHFHASAHASGLAEAMQMEFPDAFSRAVSESANGHSHSQSLTHTHEGQR
jgi:hypothetical protein